MFSEKSLFGRIFGFLGQLIGLNLLWIVCSLPIFTIGASTTALYYCTLKLHKYGDCCVFKDFFKSFRQNFRQSTMVWLILLAGAGCVYLEYKALPSMPGSLPQIFSYVILLAGILLLIMTLYVFPTIAAFENKTGKLISSAFYLAMKQVGYLLVMAVVTVVPMFFTLVDAKLFPVYLFLWLLCGFSLTAYVNSWFFWRLFRPFLGEDQAMEGGKKQTEESERYVY